MGTWRGSLRTLRCSFLEITAVVAIVIDGRPIRCGSVTAGLVGIRRNGCSGARERRGEPSRDQRPQRRETEADCAGAELRQRQDG